MKLCATLITTLILTTTALAVDTLTVDPTTGDVKPPRLISGTPAPLKMPDLFNRTPKEVWISADRTDGKGKGTQLDPFDGSTAVKFDALLAGFPTNITIHLGVGTFKTSFHDTVITNLKSGWTIAGAGMDQTIVQFDPALSLVGRTIETDIFSSPYNVSTDNVTIRDLTLDGVWSSIGATADAGAGAYTITDAKTTSGSATITSDSVSTTADRAWSSADFSRFVVGAGIPMTPSTTITSGSNGASLPQATINVADASAFPTGTQQIIVATATSAYQIVTCTGKTSTTFTGCSGGTGAMSTGGAVSKPSTTFLRVPATTVAAASDNADLPGPTPTPAPYTLTVASTTDFASAGKIIVINDNEDPNLITYTGKTSTTFTGCTGGTGKIHTGYAVASYNQAVLSANATATATGVSVTFGGEKNTKTNGIFIFGSNNKIQRVRAINFYGSRSNGTECFALASNAPSIKDARNNLIEGCYVEQPAGDYGTPFGVFGYAPYFNINARVINNYASGRNTGLDNIGWNTGGVNVANVRNITVSGNNFVDCFGIFYHDTAALDGAKIHDNTVARGMQGVANVSATALEKNLEVSNNVVEIQNRQVAGAVYGVSLQEASTANVKIEGNTFKKNATGAGYYEFRGYWASVAPTNLTMRNNIFDGTDVNAATATAGTYEGNRTLAGAKIADLPDSFGMLVDTHKTTPAQNQTIATGVEATITFANNGSMSSNVFTAPAAGDYLVRANIYYDGGSIGASAWGGATLYKNGSTALKSTSTSLATSQRGACVLNCKVTLAASDTLQIKGYNGGGGTLNVENTDPTYTWIQIERAK